MTGYWDIHNHILPGVDDGSGCMSETMEMLEEEYRQGVRHIVFTPHYRRDMFAIPREEIQTVYARVCEMAADRFPEMEFYLGCEYYIHSDASVERLRGNPKYYMAGSRTVLMEFAYEASYAWIMQTVSEVRQMGLQPVVAHAERYECLYKGRDRVASGDKIEAIYMIPGWTHNIINLSETDDLVTVMTCNEIFDPTHPDTFFDPV